MVWSVENSKADEASKIRWELIPYFHGRVLDIGCGPFKCFPHFIGVDNGHHWGKHGVDIGCDADRLDLFAGQSCDAIFSSHLLEHVEYGKVPAMLREWCRVLRPGGHLVLYLPDEDQYPKVGEKFANSDHKWNVNYARVVEAMRQTGRGWDLVDYQVRQSSDEYSLFFVFKMTQGREQNYSYKLPKPAKTAAVIRYGAIGDAIQTSSLFPLLKEQGYWIDFYCQSGGGYDVLKHDPYVDRFIVQGKDEIPPQFLQEFWDYTRPKYTKWINLCESIEGTLLATPGRVNHEWDNALRAKYCDRNYLEWTHELAGLPMVFRPKFYGTLEEKDWARKTAARWGGRNIIWSLSGSSGHKVWPHLDETIKRVLEHYPDVHVTLVGDELCRILQTGWDRFDDKLDKWVDVNARVHCKSGVWSIRESLAFAEIADLVIGTETGLINSVGHTDVPKIITLSHSSREMLTKHWTNVTVLEQPAGVGCPKSPCRQLHYTWDYCPKHEETGTALCQFHITAEMMWDAIREVLGAQQRRVA